MYNKGHGLAYSFPNCVLLNASIIRRLVGASVIESITIVIESITHGMVKPLPLESLGKA